MFESKYDLIAIHFILRDQTTFSDLLSNSKKYPVPSLLASNLHRLDFRDSLRYFLLDVWKRAYFEDFLNEYRYTYPQMPEFRLMASSEEILYKKDIKLHRQKEAKRVLAHPDPIQAYKQLLLNLTLEDISHLYFLLGINQNLFNHEKLLWSPIREYSETYLSWRACIAKKQHPDASPEELALIIEKYKSYARQIYSPPTPEELRIILEEAYGIKDVEYDDELQSIRKQVVVKNFTDASQKIWAIKGNTESYLEDALKAYLYL